jgi:Zn-dependent alcohol dehydrogenase
MRAAVLREPGTPLVIEDVDLDSPKAGEVVVRIEAAGICHSDYHYMTGDISCPLPIVLGHEGAGIIEAIGPSALQQAQGAADSGVGGSGKFSVGQRVALMWRPRCGECTACVTGHPVLCERGRFQAQTGGLLDGTSRLHEGSGETFEQLHHFLGVSCFADRVVVSEKSIVAVPDGVPAEIAAIAGCAVITGVGAALNVVEEGAGRPLLVLGAGGVGLSAVMGARLIGANPIIVVDVDEAKLDLARRFGATHTVNATTGDVVEQVHAIVPDGVAWAIEAIGRAQTLEQAFACLEPLGTVVAVGLARVGATVAVPINELVQRQKRLVGCLYGSANPITDLPRIFGLYQAGLLPLDELIGARLPLESVNEAYADLAGGSVGRAILVP